MQYFPAALQNLADQFARLPGIGGKTAQRLAFHVLSLPEESAQAFADAIIRVSRMELGDLRTAALEKFSFDRMIERTKSAYLELK